MSSKHIFPDYQGGSIVNLMSSIITGRGGESEIYTALDGLDLSLLHDAQNVVLIVIDGLGYQYLMNHGNGSQLQQHLLRPIHSVAPPTTAASVSTFLTGVAPQQHGLTGWFTWFREMGTVVTVLPFLTRGGHADLSQSVTPEELLGLKSIFSRVSTACYSITPDWLGESVFNRALLDKAELVLHNGLDDFYDKIATTVQRNSEQKYIYAYWPKYDALAHEHGVGSDAVATHFSKLDEGFTNLVQTLKGSDTLVLLTADHGFVDTTPDTRLNVADLSELKRCLRIPLCGEPRTAYCYVQHEMRNLFERYVQSELGHAAVLHRSDELIQQGLFGLGEAHSELYSRVGDYTLMMKDNYVLTQRLPGEGVLTMVGHHGGLSPAEVNVPLVMAVC